MLLSRQGRGGRFSFATLVRRAMAPPPLSVAAEARQLQVEHSLEEVTAAALSFGRSKLRMTAANSLETSEPEDIGAGALAE